MTEDREYLAKDTTESKDGLKSIKLHISKSGGMYIVHKAITKQLNEKRQGNANCKTKSEVRGGGKKPWKQKGTGRARAGSNRSPLWRGGGIIFGPKTKRYSQKVNKKERQLAIRNTLFNKQNFTIHIASDLFILDEPKTKVFISRIQTLKIEATEKILIIVSKKSKNMLLAARNLHNIEVIAADQLNLLSIMRAKWLLVDINSMKIIKEMHNGQRKRMD